MRNIIFALIFSFSTAVLAQTPIELAPDAPDHHVVVRGDTLWGISKMFLKDPFRWPEVWHMNAEQVKNPHRIYPGQVIILDRSGGDPRLKIGTLKLSPQVRAEPIPEEIPSIPPHVIEPFLAQPLVIDVNGFAGSPRIISSQEDRVVAGNGDTVYAAGVDPKVGLWQAYLPGKPLIDPDSGETLGIEAIYHGNVRVSGPVAAVTPLQVTTVKQEIAPGDWLTPAGSFDIVSYMPHKPAQAVSGRVLGLYGGVGEGGRSSIVSISRGKHDGLEMGHVLAMHRAGTTVTNRFEDSDKPQVHTLPDVRYGLVFIFRVFDRVSYGLVTEASLPVIAGDRVTQP